ncbi:MAG: hypothetical protein ACE1ZG_04690 [Gammaproteobacteria bacterium]
MDTRVTLDGVVVRTTRMDSYIRDKLESNYILLPGGQWSVKEEKDSYRKNYIYQTKRRYEADVPIPSDYVRKSDFTDETSHNTIQLQILNFGIFKLFTYEETFRDVTDTEKAIAVFKKFYSRRNTILVNQIIRRYPGKFSRSEVDRVISKIYDPLMNEFAKSLREKGKEAFDSDAFRRLFDDEWVTEQIAMALVPTPGHNEEAFKLSIASALKLENEQLESMVSEKDLQNFFGVYGLSLFDSYPFNLSLYLPGRLLRHNGELTEDNRLMWEFKSEDFIWDPYLLWAQSFLLYPVRLFITGVVCLLIVSILIFARKRRARAITSA